jgi:hypothetical protein
MYPRLINSAQRLVNLGLFKSFPGTAQPTDKKRLFNDFPKVGIGAVAAKWRCVRNPIKGSVKFSADFTNGLCG